MGFAKNECVDQVNVANKPVLFSKGSMNKQHNHSFAEIPN
jgi:hypothetical protein